MIGRQVDVSRCHGWLSGRCQQVSCVMIGCQVDVRGKVKKKTGNEHLNLTQ